MGPSLMHIFILVSALLGCVVLAADRIVIQGPGNFAYRMEIHDFVKNKKFFTLYVRALQSFQNITETDDTSFFAAGGIHGLPYTPWNGATGGFQGTTDRSWTFGGYCTHGTVLFPTWHRPYVMLYEQRLQSVATQIASQFTVDKDAWAQAALQLRQPYWDWANYSLPPDEVIRQSTVTITNFNGQDVAVANPLLRYKFKAKLPLSYFKGTSYTGWQTTLRQPNALGTENINRMVSNLNNGHAQTRADTVSLLTNVHDWDGFSNHASSENSITNSLESIHDNIHVQVGGNGHMGDPAVAGFDPIFFLHHCNVDRMISLWAAMNPGVWVTPGAAPAGGTFTISPKSTVDTNSDLTPFWNSQTTFWKSSQVTDTSSLGYAYADFQGVDLSNSQAVRNRVVQIINLYQTGTSSKASRRAVTDKLSGSPVLNWSLRIRSKHNELHRPYSVLIFLGDVPEDHTQWLDSPNLVGVENAFANSACDDCPDQADAVSESILHINDYISRRHPELGSFNENVITPFLTKQLSWKVIDTTENPVDLTSLEVTAFSVPMTWKAGADFPTAGKIKYHHGVTHGKRGGSTAQVRALHEAKRSLSEKYF